MDAESFGKLVASRRHALGLTQAELASKIHVTSKAVSRWECGRGFPEMTLMTPLAHALQMDVAELLEDTSSRHEERAVLASTTSSQAASEEPIREDGGLSPDGHGAARMSHFVQRLPYIEFAVSICMVVVWLAGMHADVSSSSATSFPSLIWSWCAVFGPPLLAFCLGRFATQLLTRSTRGSNPSFTAKMPPEFMSLLMLFVVITGLFIYLVPLLTVRPPLFVILIPYMIMACPKAVWLVLGALQGLC